MLRDKKEKMIDENGNNLSVFVILFKFIMVVGSLEKESYWERINCVNREESLVRKENVVFK